jgi:hypothetical protein
MYGSVDRALFDAQSRDNCTEPYIKLRDRCRELGYQFESVKKQRLDECAWVIFWDAASITPDGFCGRLFFKAKTAYLGGSPRDVLREARQAGMEERLVLMVFEPPTVCPQNYDLALHERFSVIFTCDPYLVDNRKYHRIYFPNPANFPDVVPKKWNEKKLLVNISSCKFSSHERELYTEVRKTIRFFEANYPTEFDLYGMDWNMGLATCLLRRLRGKPVRREFFPSYRGRIRHKWDIFPAYKFALCYENIVDQPGYVTLKTFDCLRSNCVPVYLGAPDIDSYVDREAFIDRRDFKSMEELAGFLLNMNQSEHERYLEAGRRYLEGPKFKLFLSENFVETIVTALNLVEGSRNAQPVKYQG